MSRVVNVVVVVASLLWCLALEIRMARLSKASEALSQVEEDCRKLEAGLDELEGTLQQESDSQKELLESRLTDVEIRIQDSIQGLRKDMRSLRLSSGKGKEGGPSAEEPDKVRTALKSVPQLDEASIPQVMGALDNMLGLDQDQSKVVEDVLKKNLGKVNKLREEVESGERNAEDALAEAQDVLNGITEEVAPVLNESQNQVLKKLIENLGTAIPGSL